MEKRAEQIRRDMQHDETIEAVKQAEKQEAGQGAESVEAGTFRTISIRCRN